ncbi:hypothetical protein [Allokutzneria sp. NRRL B-24872]|uniref:hypothetical protein n=1 Tax=Allokutzneria sp. NRRL B-24872 TaxID=1137961 RepID=UPI001AEFDD8D|nr:hypothetical protein [Allokutzneria sp. NRRL B-24872]
MHEVIEELLPLRGAHDLAGLREVDADLLARYVAAPENDWWRRRRCAEALDGRVPRRRVEALIARAQDLGETAEVRRALLDVLADREELLPWLLSEERQHDTSYGMAEAFLKARGRLGDRTALHELVLLAADPWTHRQLIGLEGLEALIERHGAEVLLAEVGDDLPQERLFHARMRFRAGEDVTDALADPDRTVAHFAHELEFEPRRLREYIAEAPTTEAKVWAACALHEQTGDLAEIQSIYDALGRPRVEVDGLDEEIRAAIVHNYVPTCQRQTDPRWRLEYLCMEHPASPDVDDQLRRAVSALSDAGLAPNPPIRAGEHHGSGDDTYHVIFLGDSEREVWISTLGRFATGDDEARSALADAGFRWIEFHGAAKVTGLHVYYFGARAALTVDSLLFYWQD